MSYTQFGYSSYATSSPFVLGSTGQSSSSQSGCYERSGVTPESQTSSTAVCSLPPSAYDSRLLSSYPRLATGLTASTTGLYGAPAYASTDQAAYPSLGGVEPSPFYPTLNSAYGMKETSDPWRGISQSASYYYDPTLAAYGYGGLDFNGARRKNVTRDSTSTLKAWLNEHRKNPYPTKGEKIMLAIITKMTLTQVSTWFANARRRLKKENKMTWEPRNKTDQDEEKKNDVEEDDEDDTDDGGKGDDEGTDRRHGNQADASRFGEVDRMDGGGPDSVRNGILTNGEVGMGADHIGSRNSLEADLSSHLLRHHQQHTSCHAGAPGVPKIPEDPAAFAGASLVDPSQPLVQTHPCGEDPHRSPLSSLSCQPAAASAASGGGSCFTPSVSSQSSSPDLSSIDSYISSPTASAADAKDATMSGTIPHSSVGMVPTNPAYSSRGGDDLLAGHKPKIWSLADTATNKAAGSSLLVDTSLTYSGSDQVWSTGSNLSQGYGSTFHSFGGPSVASGSSAPYNCGLHGFNPVSLQTDTPPQTPPNMKVSSALSLHHVTTAVPSSYADGQSHLFLGQTAVARGCVANAHLSQVDKHCGRFPSSHVTSLPQTSTSSQRVECVGEEYATHAQYRDPPVH